MKRCLRISYGSISCAPPPSAPSSLRRCSRSAAARPWTPSPSLEPLDVVTGWYDDGIIEGGKNKLVPSVTHEAAQQDRQGAQVDPDQRDLPPRRRAGNVGRVFRLGDPAHRAAARRRRDQDAGDALDARLHRRSAAHADAAEPRVRRRQGRDLSQAGIEGPRQARRVSDPATAAHAQSPQNLQHPRHLRHRSTSGTCRHL